jgi:uncharacterized protein YndB with AHSA1/START domain
MSVKIDGSGRRSVQVEVEVPGTPEQVWRAIATGPGITAWFVPSEVEEREGGTIAFHLGADMDSSGIVTAWEPPARFAYEERDWGPNNPPLATEVFVEARAGGTCIVHMEHSLFASTDEWDDQLENMESGWRPFFNILRLYLTHFPGQPASGFRLIGDAPGSEEDSWDLLAKALGITRAHPGDRHITPLSGLPHLAGAIERIGSGKNLRDVLLRLEEPAPGAAFLGVATWGGKVHIVISLYLYGKGGAEVAAREEASWRRWLESLAFMSDVLITTYKAFNARDIDAVLAVLHPEVDWPNGWEGGRVHGHEGVRDYWTRQWAAIDPNVEPVGFERDAEGRTTVRVHQVVRDLEGNVVVDGWVEHVYTIEDGLIRRMDIREPAP